MRILGIETSCDETAAAIVEDGKRLLTNVVASSADMHIKYGGIVPEVAARKQIESILPVLTEAMTGFTKDDIDAIAVTVGPGLIGSLLVGVETAKTLAFVWSKPIIPVNHVLAHIYGVFLTESDKRKVKSEKKIRFPAVALVVSGGHTELYLMTDEKSLKWLGGTLDDAAGECFDKCARLLGLPYPGGPQIAKRAQEYLLRHPERSEGALLNGQSSHAREIPRQARNGLIIKLPRPMIHDGSLNFSFSGLKTAVLREWQKQKKPNKTTIATFSHEIQESITDVLVNKALKAAFEYNIKSLIVTGGVAANQRLTQKFTHQLAINNYQFSFHVPPPSLCVDSASYISAYAYYHNHPVVWHESTAKPNLSVEV